MTDKQTSNQPCTLHLERRHGPKKKWEKIAIKEDDPVDGMKKLRKHLPDGGEIGILFTNGAAIIEANFKIKLERHIIRPDERITLRRMSGRHSLAIDGISYVAVVN